MACVALENHFGGKDSSNAGNRVSGAYFGYQDSTDRLEASMTDKGDMLSHLKTFISDHSSEWSVSDGESPRGATELYGGFPRMTFCTLDETQKEPSIVLGFTAASWSPNSKPLRDWATESRKESLKRYKGCQILGRRKRAVDTLRQSERQHGGWSQTHMIEAVRDFRDTEQLKPFGQGPRGFAIEFPGLCARKRCMVCLACSEYRVAAEGAGLASAIVMSAYATNAESCAELEACLLTMRHNRLRRRRWGRKLQSWGRACSKTMGKCYRRARAG